MIHCLLSHTESCAGLVLTRSADYPESAARATAEGRGRRRFAQTDRTAIGLVRRHRSTFAQDRVFRAFAALRGPSCQAGGASQEAGRLGVGVDFAAPFQEADRSYRTQSGGGW